MCGIAGAVAFRDGGRPDRDRLCTMAGLMAHRGPDGEGFWADPRGRVALVHRRLSIIDIAGGRQPMCSDDGQIALVFNGEIYNYRELRRSLSDEGVQFHTASDTEVLLRMYERYGSEAVRYLRGMFAFAVWDGGRGELVLARDRVGKKPLFYALEEDFCYFASTLGALRDTDPRTPPVDLGRHQQAPRGDGAAGELLWGAFPPLLGARGRGATLRGALRRCRRSTGRLADDRGHPAATQ
ncbi:MAG: hypothetical protein DMD42_09520 [Gemmatimonadetes bacterium]|nr:MAG: hypothetical protein DMD42_09520 [Gemmatimonadota bacterium]